jgi:transposase
MHIYRLSDATGQALLSKGFWKPIAAQRPADDRSPKGGPLRISDRAALNGILFVLKARIPRQYLPRELGGGCDCNGGMTCWRRIHEQMLAGVWLRTHEAVLPRLRE